MFTYNKETDQYGNVDPEFKEPSELKRKTKFRKREILDIEFGSVYLLDKFLEQEQIWKLVDAIGANYPLLRSVFLFSPDQFSTLSRSSDLLHSDH